MREPVSGSHRSRRPGRRRRAGSPNGPDEVRPAVLDAAAALFAVHGIDAVSLRDIAAAADVNLSLTGRYTGRRDELVAAMFGHVCDQLAGAVEENPLSGQGFSPDTVMGKWVRIAAALVISGRSLEGRPDFNPVVAIAETLVAGYGPAGEAARVRAAQIVAAALGWRIFEACLVQAGGLEAVPVVTLREELARSARRLGATPLALAARPPASTR
jgi:TetR/AcrR family transcriptional regulator, repressor for neighboring sulfatase